MLCLESKTLQMECTMEDRRGQTLDWRLQGAHCVLVLALEMFWRLDRSLHANRLEAIALGVEAIVIRVEAIISGLEEALLCTISWESLMNVH